MVSTLLDRLKAQQKFYQYKLDKVTARIERVEKSKHRPEDEEINPLNPDVE